MDARESLPLQADPLRRTSRERAVPGAKEAALWAGDVQEYVPLAWAPYAMAKALRAGKGVYCLVFGGRNRMWVELTLAASGLGGPIVPRADVRHPTTLGAAR